MVKTVAPTLSLQVLTAMHPSCYAFMAPKVARRKPEDTLIDVQALMHRLEGDQALLAELTTLFLAVCPPMLTQLQAALENHDRTQVDGLMVTWQGMLGNLGATERVLAQLHPDTLWQQHRQEGAAAAHATIADLLERFAHALAALQPSR